MNVKVRLLTCKGGQRLISCQLSTYIYNRHTCYSLIYWGDNGAQRVLLSFQVLAKLGCIFRGFCIAMNSSYNYQAPVMPFLIFNMFFDISLIACESMSSQCNYLVCPKYVSQGTFWFLQGYLGDIPSRTRLVSFF